MRTKTIPLCAVVVIGLTSCNTITDNVVSKFGKATSNKRSYQRSGEGITIHAKRTKVGKGVQLVNLSDPNTQSSAFVGFGLGANLLPAIVALPFNQVEKSVSESAENYSATWFKRNVGDLNGIDKFTVRRALENNQSAMEIDFEFEKIASFYTLKLTNLRLEQAKAMMTKRDDDLDIIIIVELKIPETKTGTYVTVLNFPFTIRNVKLPSQISFREDQVQQQSPLFMIPTGHTAGIPYDLLITVQEISNFSDTAEKGMGILKKKKEDALKSLLEAVGNNRQGYNPFQSVSGHGR
jgi:hypothetical protein